MIGLAGCGRMGAPMLAALRRAGFAARGFDVRPLSEFGAAKSTMCADPAEFAEGLTTLISVVRDIPQTEELLFTHQGFANIDTLQTVIICSTLSPVYMHDLRARVAAHITLVDAPMSGAAHAAQDARLTFMLGGSSEVLTELQPLFAAMGTQVHHMGAYGAGMQAKVLNNLLAASNTAMTRLVLDWAEAAGLDQRKLLDLIAVSSGQNWFASGFDTIEFARDGLEDDNTIGILVKDVESALDAAPQATDTTLPRAVQTAIANLTPRS